MPAQTTILGLSFRYALGESGWNTGYDNNWRILEVLLRGGVESTSTIAEPGSPADGDLYIVPPSATGTNWSGEDDKLAYYDGAASGGADEWVFITALEGMSYRAKDEDKRYFFDGTSWTQLSRTSASSGITASTTQTQGQEPLVSSINEISTCANANDTVTAPALLSGMSLTVVNNGAQTLQLFPASGDNLGAGVDTAVTISSGNSAKFEAYSNGVAEQII